MSFFDRQQHLQRLATEDFDVVVIGGGITGVGVALDAVTRGLRTALVERDDFAAGTSSKSSKLIHGGLRYLQQGEVKLVYEALHERQRLRRNAPHLVQILPFMIPILTRDGLISRKIARALGTAMWMYDLTGGWRIGRFHRRLKADDACRHLPTLPRERVAAAYLYYDATADDARLCLSIARTAAQHGAAVANQCGVEKVLHDADGKVRGVRVKPHSGDAFDIRARTVVNATGVWADEVRQADSGLDPHSIRPAKGIHITLPWKLVRNDVAVVIPVRKDKRNLFIVPWIANGDGTFQYTYVGTTDTDYSGNVNESQCSAEDIEYVLNALNAAITSNITSEDVTGVWSGLRPLVRNADGSAGTGRTADLSRKHKVQHSPSGMISITGGKLTTYRQMAQDTVDVVLRQLGRGAKCRTKHFPLIGAEGFSTPSLSGSDAHLAQRYGTELSAIQELVRQQPLLAEPLIPGLPYMRAEAIFAVQHEMALTLDDVLTRRTRAHLINRGATLAHARQVAELIAPELHWTPDEVTAQVANFVAVCAREEAAGQVSEAEFLASHS
ncbi:MAG: glycerol-3-phosphate dehydrogenase/oxidase [Ilumatobacteraceae bacterium]